MSAPVRRYRPEDRAGVRRVVESVLKEHRLWSSHRAQLGDLEDPRGYRRGGGEFLVVEHAGRVVGCGGLRVERRGLAVLQRMYLLPRARGRGLGRRLLARLERRAKAAGARRLALETATRLNDAIRLYLAFGYHAVLRDCGGCCRLLMFKELHSAKRRYRPKDRP